MGTDEIAHAGESDRSADILAQPNAAGAAQSVERSA
jgi:hypothetical protein